MPCPVMAESEVGKWGEIKSCIPGLEGKQVVSDVDLRRDAPKYMVRDILCSPLVMHYVGFGA